MSPRKPKLDLVTEWIRIWMLGLIGGTVALVPLWVPTYVFIGVSFNKAALFYVLITILVLLYLILIWRDKDYLPKFNLVVWSFLGLVVVLGLSTITSVQPYLSFWGTFNRTDGFLMWLYYLVFFIITANVIATRADWWKVIGIGLVGTLGVVLYGLGQALRIPGVERSVDSWRVESALANPVFLGIYLALALPFTLAWALTRRIRIWKWAGLVLVSLELVVLILTLSRGAWLAVAISLGVAGLIYSLKCCRSKLRLALLGLMIGIVLVVGGWLVGQGMPEKSVGHLLTDKMVRTESLIIRYQTWRVAVQAFWDKPILGWGLENFSVAYDQNYRSKSTNVTFQDVHADRPHNAFIGMAIDGGGVGLLFYLILLIAAIRMGYLYVSKLAKNFEETILYLSYTTVVVAYAVCMLTAFQLVDTSLFFLLALAGLAQIANKSLNWPHWFQQNRAPILLIIGIGLTALLYWSTIKPLVAIHLADQATIVFQKHDFAKSEQLFRSALKQQSYLFNPIRGQMVVLADNARADFNSDAEFNDFQRQTGEWIQQNHSVEPLNSYYYLIFGMYYGHLAQVWPEYLAQADAEFARVAHLAPGKAETYWQWGTVYGLLGKTDKAKIKYAMALELEPANQFINYQVGKWYLVVEGDLDQGITLIKKSLTLGYMPKMNDIKSVIQFLKDKGRLEQVGQICQMLMVRNPAVCSDLISASE